MYGIESILTWLREFSALVSALSVNILILFFGDVADVSVEFDQVDSIVILEFAFKRVSAAVANSKAFEVEVERISFTGVMES